MLVVVFTLTALSVHLVPILGERGLGRQSAALVAALAGTIAIFGKLATGWMNDRWASGWINAISMALPSLGCLLLLTNSRACP
jgi:MFS family permease